MLTRATAAMIIAICAVGMSSQASESQAAGEQNSRPAVTDDRGTDEKPLAVKIIPTQPSRDETEKAEAEKAAKATVDRRLALETQRIADYTKWLAGITAVVCFVAVAQALLFWWQLRLIKDGARDAAAAANAAVTQANIAQRTFAVLERPYLYISGVRHFDLDEDPNGLWPVIRYRVANYGKVAAVIDAVYIQNCREEGAFPTQPMLTDLSDNLLADRILGPGAERENTSSPSLMDFVFPENGHPIPKLERDGEFFFYIVIEYHGPFTTSHVTKACWYWHDGEGVFARLNDEKYNHMT